MNTDAADSAPREKVAALEADKRTLEAHVELLRMHNAALDARAEHVADLRAHAGTQQQHGDALKAQHDSAMHELRLQHERAVAALTRQIELLHQLPQSKDRQLEEKDEQHRRVVATLTQQTELLQQLLQSKDRHTASLERQLEEKNKQLPELVKAAAADSLRSEVTSLHAALREQESAVATRVAALEARAVKRDAELAAAKQYAEQVAGAPPGRVVTAANVVIGRRVQRGPDWKSDDQDGGPGGLGTVSGYTYHGWCKVRWDHGVELEDSKYRIGAQRAHDLVYADCNERDEN
jgi:chromosome segregation ATPase